MDIFVVARILGLLAYCVNAVLMIPFGYAMYAGEGHAASVFFGAAFMSLLLGGWLRQTGHEPKGDLTLREGIAITTLGWLMVSVLSMQPYLYGGWLGPIDGAFEAISGLSGTGATVIDALDSLPRSLRLWRSLTNWVGGIGIIVIFIALLPEFGRGAVYIVYAEATGPTKEKQVPRIRDNAAALFKVYLAFTAICTLSYVLCGLDAYDAVNHAMATIATGGFSPYGASVMYYDNPMFEACAIFFMMISSGSFGMHLQAWKQGVHVIWENTEFRVFVGLFLIATAVISLDLTATPDWSLLHAIRCASFQVASISSSTGFVSDDFDVWPPFAKSVLLLLMFFGGCGGSTSGGFKIKRLVLLVKMLKAMAWQKLHPQIVAYVRMDGAVIPYSVLYGVARHFFIYVMLIALFSFVMVFDGVSMLDAVGVSVSTVGSVGPAFGIAGATCTYSALPPLSKLVACFLMFIGRLEIITVFALMQPAFWRWRRAW